MTQRYAKTARDAGKLSGMRFLTSEIAAVVGGVLDGPDVFIDGATQDSRAIASGQLFVPVVADRDGHDFIGAAVRAGAAAYLSSVDDERSDGTTAVRVADTVDALQAVGRHARLRLTDVVGITGSAGKTSTKDLIAAAIAGERRTHASEKSFNNELGVPLTLLNAPSDTEVTVVEMGARGIGHIEMLCQIATPSVGVVTTVGNAHTSEFGSLAGVVEAKGELVESLPSNGAAVLNAMVREVAAMEARTEARVLTFGVDTGDVRATNVQLNDDLTSSFSIESDWPTFEVRLGARGIHNVANAAAACAVAQILDIPAEVIVAGLAEPGWSPWRMEMATAANGLIVLNDSYNANPLSVAAALESLASVPATRRIAVLGVMAELGDEEISEHRRIAQLATSLGIEVVAIDAPAYGAEVHLANRLEALEALGALGAGDAILVKGSRVAGLELLAEELLATA